MMQNILLPKFQALKRRWSGFWSRNRSYTRFVILGRSRTGSNYLRGLLASHGRILVYGEILKNDQAVEWGIDGMAGGGEPLRLLQQSPAQFLESEVFKPYPAQIAAVGFKLFYYHAQQPALQPAWPYLLGQTDLRVIHLKRRNILRTHLSRQRAAATDRWTNVNGRTDAQPPLELAYEECLRDFEQTRLWEEEAGLKFADHPILDVDYEDLAASPGEQMQSILHFLQVPPARVAPQTYPQSHLPLAQAISNYGELKQRFQGTPWASFFEDEAQAD